jgi:hypothetical protein
MASNDEIVTLLNNNHIETVQRLTRLETKLEAIEDIPERVSRLENKNSWYSGVIAAVSALFGSGLTIISLRK